MLGIHKTPRLNGTPFFWWIYSWCQIPDSLIGILSFRFLNSDLAECRCWGTPPTIRWEVSFTFRERVKWWIADWIMILESLFTILMFGYFTVIWSNWLFHIPRRK